MLHRIDKLQHYKLNALDGEIGNIADFYFEDTSWNIRYLIADTGNWLAEKLVLISPAKIRNIQERTKSLQVKLSRERIEKSPPLEKDQPVSRQKEIELLEYYQDWPDYWATLGQTLPSTPVIIPRAFQARVLTLADEDKNQGDPHLRSCREVCGYQLQAANGKIGHIEDFLVNETNWRISYLVIDTKNWLPWSKTVLISPDWISEIRWSDQIIKVRMTVESIKSSPPYDQDKPVSRTYIDKLNAHYHKE